MNHAADSSSETSQNKPHQAIALFSRHFPEMAVLCLYYALFKVPKLLPLKHSAKQGILAHLLQLHGQILEPPFLGFVSHIHLIGK